MKRILLSLFIVYFCSLQSVAQCSTTALNWDALDYYATGGYTGYTLTSTLAPNQTFAFGKARLNITYATLTSAGENGTHTGSTGSYGSGDDVQYTGNGTITLNFSTIVTNVKFSVYDIDKGQTIAFTANKNGTAVPVTVAKTNTSSALISITGSTVASQTGSEANTDNTTSVNVDITDSVTSITMTVTGSDSRNGGASDQHFWLSDIAACVTGSFPTSYYAVSKPFTGMPSYILVAANKGVYQVDPATGKAKLVFTDGATSGTINSVAYDPYNKVIYYCWSLTNNGSANASERTLRKYDYTTNTTTTVINDVNTVNLPALSQGVESGAAAFYDGALYLGIEGGADGGNGGPRTSTGGRESVIWRIDSLHKTTPVITQVYAVDGDTHDWSDFSINNGTLYDFNGDASSPDYVHVSLQTGAKTVVPYVTTAPKQSAVGWDGTIYWVSNSVATYNLNGSIGTQVAITGSPAIPNWSNSTSPSFGDAAEAYRPPVDFGDAPDTYDPDPSAPALHEVSSTLRLGATTDVEWDKAAPGTTATIDGVDEDGLAYTTILVNNSNYITDVSVYNNTGANATICAWIDFNNDGIFQASEGITQTVLPSTTAQTVSLFWSNPTTTLLNNSYTYLRIRLTSAANGMTTSNPTGYFADGEVEDYRILVSNSALNVRLSSFAAQKIDNDNVKLTWAVNDESPRTIYELQKSRDGQAWTAFQTLVSDKQQSRADYSFMDKAPFKGTTYYRLKVTRADGTSFFSNTGKIVTDGLLHWQIAPNPASTTARLIINTTAQSNAVLKVTDLNGRIVHEQRLEVKEGENLFNLPVEQLQAGIYHAEIRVDEKRSAQTLVIRR